MSLNIEDKSFIKPVLDAYTSFMACYDLKDQYRRVYIPRAENLKAVLGLLLGLTPYGLFFTIALNYYPSIINNLVEIATPNNIVEVFMFSSLFVAFNFLIYKVLHKVVYVKMRKYCFPNIESLIKQSYFNSRIKACEAREKELIDIAANYVISGCKHDNSNFEIINRLGLLADESAIHESSIFYERLIKKISDLGEIEVNIFEYNDKVGRV